MKKFCILSIIITSLLDATAQVNRYGVPFIKNYPTQVTPGSEQNWCITRDIFGNVYFGNQDKGVIRFDGIKWTAIQIKNNPRIFALTPDERGIIYVGAAYEFGYLQPDKKGNTEYVSLAERIDSVAKIRIIYSIAVKDEKVFFLGPRYIYIYNRDNDSLSSISLIEYNLLDAYKMALVNGRLLITDNLNGLYELRDSTIIQLPGGSFFRKKLCTVVLPYDESKVLICTFSDGVFLYDFKTGIVKDDFIDRTINERFKVVIIYAAAKIPGDIYAIGTTTDEGILFFDKNGRLLSRLNKGSSDLEDNTILALYCDPDKNSELWISTNGIISKAYTNLPLTKFDSKQGIDNAVNEICKFGGNIYLSTDAGILRTYTEDNTFRFRKLPGTDSQFFPLSVFKSSRGDFLLAGYLDGIIQVSRNDVISEVEKNCLEFPRMSLNTKSILQSSRDPDIVYIGDEVKGVIILRYEGDHWRFLNRIKIPSGSLSEIAEQGENNLWVMTDDPNGIYRIDISSNKLNITGYGRDKGVDEIELFSMDIINGDLYISTGSGILKYNKTDDNFAPDRELTAGAPGIENVQNLFIDEDGDLILSGFNSRYSDMLFSKSETGTRTYRGVFNLLPNVPTLDLLSSEGRYFLTKSKIVAVLGKDRLVQDTTRVSPRFVSITVGSDSIVMDGMFHSDIDGKRRLPQLKAVSSSVPEYSYDMNRIAFEWTTSHFIEEGQTEYSYKLEGYDREWSRWEGISFGFTAEGLYSKKEYTNLPYGHYIFKVRNRTLTGLTGDELTFEFIILKPWYSTILAFIMFSLIGILIIILIISTYTKRLKRENIRLEGIVTERTAVVVKQKEELESSIHYASRIQMALLPSEKILSENIRNYFVLFKPRDIVSGDFYWMTKKGDRLYIVAADCTGHGVPGAFMSLLGMSFLDEIIDKDVSRRADAILNELRLHVTESLKQVGEDDETKDGMDIALLVIDFGTQRVEFSGAYNPCFRVRKLSADEMRDYQQNLTELPDGSMSDGKYLLETIYASKMPIGISSKMNEKFDFHDWSLEKGISYYLFSDGYIDQFGGKNGRKFMKKNFKKLILQVQDFPMSKQKNILENTLREWMGNSPQIDDILVMGIRTE